MARRKVEPRKRGRPATGKDPLVNARMPEQMIHNIDRWAIANGLSRSEALRQLLGYALKRTERRAISARR